MSSKLLHYKDVVLADPRYSEVRSRDEIKDKLQINFLGFLFKSPCIPANMLCSIDFEMAEKLDSMGYFYILHRFYDYDEIYDWLTGRKSYKVNSISVGVRDKDKKFIKRLSNDKIVVDFITIDIAFGHSVLMKEMIKHIKDHLPNTKIIAGNVCTPQAVSDLIEWGADSIKIGLSMGKACTTYNSTGVGSPMFSTILKCMNAPNLVNIPYYKDGNYDTVKERYNLRERVASAPIIADGGIRENGDILKALVAGASMVMVGSKMVECVDSPAENVRKTIMEPIKCSEGYIMGWTKAEGDIEYKKYFGSASAKNKGKDSYVEGVDEVLLKCNGLTYSEYLNKVNESVVSCMSYHNLRDVKQMPTIHWSTHSM